MGIYSGYRPQYIYGGSADQWAVTVTTCGVHACLQVVYSGAYRCVCVQIKLHHMAVNATAQAGVIEELEGATLHDSSLDPHGSGPAFKVLKQLVSNWLTDAVQNHNRYDQLLMMMS